MSVGWSVEGFGTIITATYFTVYPCLFAHVACDEGFYGDECENRCQCRNASECHFVTGSCTCQAGFAGLTCHDPCPDSSYGLGCALACECFTSGTRSCDPISGSCDCNEQWMGELCDGKEVKLASLK